MTTTEIARFFRVQSRKSSFMRSNICGGVSSYRSGDLLYLRRILGDGARMLLPVLGVPYQVENGHSGRIAYLVSWDDLFGGEYSLFKPVVEDREIYHPHLGQLREVSVGVVNSPFRGLQLQVYLECSMETTTRYLYTLSEEDLLLRTFNQELADCALNSSKEGLCKLLYSLREIREFSLLPTHSVSSGRLHWHWRGRKGDDFMLMQDWLRELEDLTPWCESSVAEFAYNVLSDVGATCIP